MTDDKSDKRGSGSGNKDGRKHRGIKESDRTIYGPGGIPSSPQQQEPRPDPKGDGGKRGGGKAEKGDE